MIRRAREKGAEISEQDHHACNMKRLRQLNGEKLHYSVPFRLRANQDLLDYILCYSSSLVHFHCLLLNAFVTCNANVLRKSNPLHLG